MTTDPNKAPKPGLKRIIQYEITQARTFQEDHPEAARDYRNGMTLDQIVVKYDVARQYASLAHNRMQAARCIVGFSMRGNLFPEWGPVFEGSIPCEELERIQTERSAARGRALIEALSTEDIKRGGKRGAEARGYSLWGPEEMARLESMNEDPKYKSDSGNFYNNQAAQDLNNEYHGGNKVRNANGVRFMRKRLLEARESLNLSTATQTHKS